MSPQPCYCINPQCQRPNDPSSITNNFCISCGSSLILNGKYRVKQLLKNDSGFGIIYEAESTQRKILKVLKPEHNNDPKVIELFKQEYQVL
jgi:serine/threonine protein kinase